MSIVAKRNGGRPHPRRLCVRWGPNPLPNKGVEPPFSAHVYCGQVAAWIKMPLGTEVGLGPDDNVRLEPSYPLHKKGAKPPPQFSVHVYCRQTAGWIKMALGMEVGLGPGHIVVDGDPAPVPKKGADHFISHYW